MRGRKVFIKPNLVVPYGSPYTTAPELVSALVHFCLENGAASVHIGEMAISNFSSRMTLVSTGLQQYWESIDPARVIVHVMDEEEFTWVELEDAEENARHGVTFGRFFLPVALLEEDTFYIDVPKMKTHLQSSVTLGIKNAHGLVPECDRGRSHQRISQKVVDICKVWAPHLTIVDGYEALEGIGPWPGDPLPLRALVVSNDVVQADFVSTQLMKKEEMAPDFSKDVDFRAKFVKSTWLAYEQGLGSLDKDPSGGDVVRTLGADATPVPVQEWTRFLLSLQRDFRDPEVRDEHLIKNIGARFGREPHFPYPPKDVEHDFWREYLPLDGHDPVVPYQGPLVPTSQWGPARLVSDEWRHPHVGASVMFSGMFGLLKAIFEEHFPRELAMLDGFAVVYGPLRKPLECEAALLFGDGAIATEYLLFAPRVYRMAGGGKPPNRYSETFERMSQELGGHLLGFVAETLTYSRGWYW